MTTRLTDCAGLLAAPLAWAVSTQLGQITPYTDCSGHLWSLIVGLASGGLAAAGAALSYRAAARSYGATQIFVGHLGALTGAIFAFALILQGAAAVLVDPCQR